MSGKPARARGFTLVEVMVALAIVAVALGAGLRAAAALTDNASRFEQVLAAQWCADNTITNLRLLRTLPGIGDSDLSCEQLGHRFGGKLVARPTPNPLYRRIEVRFDDEAGRPLVQLITVIGR